MSDHDEVFDGRVRQLMGEMGDTAPAARAVEAAQPVDARAASARRGPMLRLVGGACLAVFVLGAGLLLTQRGDGDVGAERGVVEVGPTLAADDPDAPAPARVLDRAGTVLFDFGDGATGDPGSAQAWIQQRVLDELLEMDELGATREERQVRISEDGLHVRATIDPQLQEVASWAFHSRVPEGLDAALVTIDHETGAVLAAAGSPGVEVGRALPAPVARVATYLAATEAGRDVVDGTGPCTVEVDGQPFSTTNLGNSSGREQSLRSQVLSSSRCSLLRLEAEFGVGAVWDSIGELAGADIAGSVPPVLAPPELSALEVATMYATVANGGIANEAFVVVEVIDAEGNVVYARSSSPQQVLAEGSTAAVHEMLRANVAGGTGSRAVADLPAGADVGGLTGTMEDFSAAWFAGWFENRTTALWVAFPGGEPMRSVAGFRAVTGGSLPAEAWGAYFANQGEDPAMLDPTPRYGPAQPSEE